MAGLRHVPCAGQLQLEGVLADARKGVLDGAGRDGGPSPGRRAEARGGGITAGREEEGGGVDDRGQRPSRRPADDHEVDVEEVAEHEADAREAVRETVE